MLYGVNSPPKKIITDNLVNSNDKLPTSHNIPIFLHYGVAARVGNPLDDSQMIMYSAVDEIILLFPDAQYTDHRMVNPTDTILSQLSLCGEAASCLRKRKYKYPILT